METILNDTSKFQELNDDILKLSISLKNEIYRYIAEIKSNLEYNKQVTPSSLHITGYIKHQYQREPHFRASVLLIYFCQVSP